MKLKHMMLTVLSLLAAQAYASPTIYSVPFSDVNVFPHSKIYGEYSFQPQKQIINCFTNDKKALTTIEWSYKGIKLKSLLPVTLKGDNKYVEGLLADTYGSFLISNESEGSDPTGLGVTVACVIIEPVFSS